MNDNKLHILVFFDSHQSRIDLTGGANLTYVMQKYHGYNISVSAVDVNLLIGETPNAATIQELSAEIAVDHYHYFYIIPEQKRLRQELRKLFHQTAGRNLDIRLYKKVVMWVKKWIWIK